MAKPADSPLAGVAELLAPFPGRLEFAARLALICALTVLVVETYQTPDPALTAYLAFFAMKPDRASSAVVSLALIVVITVILIMTLMVAMVVIDDPFRRVIAMTAVSFCFLFAASASKLKPIAAMVALIVGYAVDLLGQIQLGETAARALLYAWLFVAIPAGVSIAVNLLVGPAPRRLLEKALARRLELSAAAVRSSNKENVERLTLSLREGASEFPELLKAMDLERTSPPDEIAALRQACASTATVQTLVDLIARDPELLPAPERTRLARILDLMARFFTTRRRPTEIRFAPESGAGDLPPLTQAMIAELDEALACFAEPVLQTASPESKSSNRGGFFLTDAFTNPIHVHYAIKTTAAAIFCYVAYQMMDWSGIHTCMITCYIVSLGTTAETMEKLTLRLAGCLIGAAAGLAAIVWLMPHITSIAGLVTVVFAGALASGWIAAGGPRIAYAGYQIAFAFFLCVVQGSAPAFDLTVARDRMIGVVLGNLVVSVIFTQVWPVTVADRIDPAIEALLRLLEKFAGSGSPFARRGLAEETQRSLGAVERDLELTTYEPPSIGPQPSWVDRRRGLTAVGSLVGPLLLAADREPAIAGAVERRLLRVGSVFGSGAVDESEGSDVIALAPEVVETETQSNAACAFVEGPLAALERAVNGSHTPEHPRIAVHATA